MINKRIILIVVIIAASILAIGPLGWSPAFLIGGVVLSIFVGQKVDVKTREAVQTLQVKVSEIRERTRPEEPIPPPPPEEKPLTGQFREEDVETAASYAAPTEPLTPKPETQMEEEDPAFVIGTTDDGRTITMDEITSLGVGGVPGVGKTVSMVGLAAQAVVKYKGDVRFLLVDPHMHTGSPDALSARMAPLAPFYLKVDGLPNPVSGGSDLAKWIRWMTQQAKDRIAGKVPWEGRKKLVLMADEFTALMDDEEIGPLLQELILLINEQARKVGMFALVASPAWKSTRISGTDVRNSISSFLVHNMPPNIARQLVPNTIAEISNTLAKGQAIFSSFGTFEVVRVEYRNSKDIERCTQPYLPAPEPETIVVVSEPEPVIAEPTIAEVRSIWETYQILNQDLNYSEDAAIRALAIDVYGPGDSQGQEKVRKALKLGEEHL